MSWTFAAMAATHPTHDPFVTYPCCTHCTHGNRWRQHQMPCLHADDTGMPCPGATPKGATSRE
jgi:hypothetical protein